MFPSNASKTVKEEDVSKGNVWMILGWLKRRALPRVVAGGGTGQPGGPRSAAVRFRQDDHS